MMKKKYNEREKVAFQAASAVLSTMGLTVDDLAFHAGVIDKDGRCYDDLIYSDKDAMAFLNIRNRSLFFEYVKRGLIPRLRSSPKKSVYVKSDLFKALRDINDSMEKQCW